MSRAAVGLVICDAKDGMSEALLSRARDAMEATPPGRVLCVVFELPAVWEASANVEAVMTDAVLGRPEERSDHPEWEFFGNLAVRICKTRVGGREVVKEQAALLFRRAGDRAYVRRKSLDAAAVKAARIDAHHPVFTRDVANNVWHVSKESEVVSRLAMLLAWPDEAVLQLSVDGERRSILKRPDLEQALVGVPEKILYDWSSAPGASDRGPARLFP